MVETDFVVEEPSTGCFAWLSANYRPDRRAGKRKVYPWRLTVWRITHSVVPYIANCLPCG